MDEDTNALLTESLAKMVHDITLFTGFHLSHKQQCINLIRRIKLLLPLFEEMSEMQTNLPESVVPVLKTLDQVLQSAKLLLQSCHSGSKLYLILECQTIAKRFSAVSDDMDKALDRMPWDTLNISEEVREQVDLVHGQFSRAKGRADTQNNQLHADLMLVMSQERDTVFDTAVLQRLADKLQLRSHTELEAEAHALKCLIRERSPEVDETLEQMLDLVKELKGFSNKDASDREVSLLEKFPSLSVASIESTCPSLIPDDYRCPISLEIMKDPVIIATGQTYERANIQKWLEQNRTCPKTSQVLPHTGLTPNFVLRSLINQWYETNGLEIPERACDSSRGGKPNLLDALVEERGTVDEIVEHLRSGQIHLQRAAAAELRSLAKQNTENRVCIAEAGAIPHLVSLLSNQDPETQEHAVTALLNLSIHERIKGTVVLAGAIPAIVKVLKYGSMGARENAAATLFSLSVVDENKLTIGALGAIPALVDLLKNGSVQGRKDAASALFNLLIYQGNKAKAVRAGVVDPVMNLLADPSTGLLDEAVSILAVLATHQEGRKAIGKAFAVPALISLLQNSTPRTKENAAAILLALSLDNPSHLATAGRLGVKRHLVELANSGTERARRKAMTLLEQLAMVEWHRDAEWETSIPLTDFDWKEVAEPVMHLYTETTDGSFIGVKESALVWHHQDADPDFGYWQAKELLDHLESVLANEPVAVKIDQHMVEVKPQVVWKMVDLQKDTRNDDIKIMEDFVLKNPLDNDQESDIETQKKGKRIMLKPRNRSFQRKRYQNQERRILPP